MCIYMHSVVLHLSAFLGNAFVRLTYFFQLSSNYIKTKGRSPAQTEQSAYKENRQCFLSSKRRGCSGLAVWCIGLLCTQNEPVPLTQTQLHYHPKHPRCPDTGFLHSRSYVVKTSFGHIPSIEQSKRDVFLQQ